MTLLYFILTEIDPFIISYVQNEESIGMLSEKWHLGTKRILLRDVSEHIIDCKYDIFIY